MEHFCQRIITDDPHYLGLTTPDDPDACGKPAHFVYEENDPFIPKEDRGVKFWLCADCYDYAVNFLDT